MPETNQEQAKKINILKEIPQENFPNDEEFEAMAKKIFISKGSVVEKLVKWASGTEELMDLQKICIAPAKGVENFIKFIFSLLHIKKFTRNFTSLIENVNPSLWPEGQSFGGASRLFLAC